MKNFLFFLKTPPNLLLFNRARNVICLHDRPRAPNFERERPEAPNIFFALGPIKTLGRPGYTWIICNLQWDMFETADYNAKDHNYCYQKEFPRKKIFQIFQSKNMGTMMLELWYHNLALIQCGKLIYRTLAVETGLRWCLRCREGY